MIGRYLRNLGLAFAILQGAFVSPDAVAADQEPERFRLYRFEQQAGEESYSFSPADGGIDVPARGEFQLGGRGSSFAQSLRVNATTYSLESYELKATSGGAGQTIRATRSADSVVIAIEAPGASLRRAFPVRGDLHVLDNLLVNHIVLLGRRVAERGFAAETVQVVVPQVTAVLQAAIVPRPVQADGARVVELRIAGVVEELRFNAEGRLDGVSVPAQGIRYERILPGVPPGAAPPARPPEVDSGTVPEQTSQPTRALFEEQHVQFLSKGTLFDGILTVPRGGQKIPYPAVVFVHGSGPLDRDETVGPNRPFFDLARGLAVYGIASLRYDKRTLIAPETIRPASVTVQEETIDDAVEAISYLRSRVEIDARRITIVGHSLGGALAPLIAQADGGIASLVLLAGTPRPLDEILSDQVRYLTDQARRQGLLTREQEAQMGMITAQLDSLRAGQLPPRRSIFGMSAHYLSDFRARDRAGAFARFPGPVLILHAGKDYQVGARDLEAWRSTIAASGKTNVTIQEFPGLGHLFIPIEGEPSPAALMQPGSVDPGVIGTIADFLLGGGEKR